MVVSQLPTHLSPPEIENLCRAARKGLGRGGTVQNREIELQGGPPTASAPSLKRKASPLAEYCARARRPGLKACAALSGASLGSGPAPHHQGNDEEHQGKRRRESSRFLPPAPRSLMNPSSPATSHDEISLSVSPPLVEAWLRVAAWALRAGFYRLKFSVSTGPLDDPLDALDDFQVVVKASTRACTPSSTQPRAWLFSNPRAKSPSTTSKTPKCSEPGPCADRSA